MGDKGRIAFTFAFWIAVAAIGVVSLMPSDILIDTGAWDKLEHAVAYGVLSTLGLVSYQRSPARNALVVGLIAYGIALEFLQSYVPGRQCDGLDMIANASGVLCGLIWAQVPRRRFG